MKIKKSTTSYLSKNNNGDYVIILKSFEFALKCQPGNSIAIPLFLLSQPQEIERLLNCIVKERNIKARIFFDEDFESIQCQSIIKDCLVDDVEKLCGEEKLTVQKTRESYCSDDWSSREMVFYLQDHQICFNCCRPVNSSECEHCGTQLLTDIHMR